MTATTVSAPVVAGPPLVEDGSAGTVVPIDIVGHGVYSAVGHGLAPIAAALAGNGPIEAGQSPDDTWPPSAVRAVAHFDPVTILGRKGLSRLTRTDQLVLAACLAAASGLPAGSVPGRTGIVLGTTVGSPGAQEAFFRDSFVQDRPYLVNPSAFPGTLMNSAAGKSAIRLGFTGLNATVSGGPLAALQALRYARGALLNGHADRLLAGGVEEASRPSAWAWRQSGAFHPAAALGEGCAVFALERQAPQAAFRDDDPRPLGKLLACETGYADLAAEGPLGVARRLADCVRTALVRSGLSADEPLAVAPGAGARRGWAGVEMRALRHVFGPLPVARLVRIDGVLGDTYAAAAALQLAAVLARWQGQVCAPGGERAAVVTAVGPDGSVGALIVARPGAC